MIIAIDGTTASGKGTISKRLSAHYGLPHMDTGRLYRATGVAALRAGVDLTDPDVWCEGWKPLVEDLEAFEALTA